MTSDPFEEFEFKPLTEGLGFHKKTEVKSSSFEPSAARSENTRLGIQSQLPEIEMPSTPARRPIADLPKKTEVGSSATVDEILKTLQDKRKFDFKDSKKATTAAQPQTAAYRTFAPDVSSLILDAMLVTAGTLSCMIILLMVTRVDLFSALNQTSEISVHLGLFMMFAGVAWIYLTMNRVFMGYTPGEWVFDQRVGLPQQLGTAGYSLRVLLRSTVVVATGLVILPLLSMLFRQDLAGQISGVSILKKV